MNVDFNFSLLFVLIARRFVICLRSLTWLLGPVKRLSTWSGLIVTSSRPQFWLGTVFSLLKIEFGLFINFLIRKFLPMELPRTVGCFDVSLKANFNYSKPKSNQAGFQSQLNIFDTLSLFHVNQNRSSTTHFHIPPFIAVHHPLMIDNLKQF